MFTVLFAIGRTPGWLALWRELGQDKEQKIARPKQIYTGERRLDFVASSERWAGPHRHQLTGTSRAPTPRRRGPAALLRDDLAGMFSSACSRRHVLVGDVRS